MTMVRRLDWCTCVGVDTFEPVVAELVNSSLFMAWNDGDVVIISSTKALMQSRDSLVVFGGASTMVFTLGLLDRRTDVDVGGVAVLSLVMAEGRRLGWADGTSDVDVGDVAVLSFAS